MSRFITLDGTPPGAYPLHVVDPGLPIDTFITDPMDVWRTQPQVRKVVDFIARNLASLPLHLYARGADDGRVRVRDGDLADILRFPAPYTTPYRFWHTIHTDGLLFDRWAFVRLLETDTEPEMLFRVPPSRFRIERGTYGTPEYLIVWPKGGGEYHLDPSTAVFDTGYSSVWNDVTPPIVALAETLNEAKEAGEYRRDLFKNGARVSGVIERPAEVKWDDAAWARFKSQFDSYKAGGGDAGGTPILEDGMTYKAVQAFEPHHLEVLAARKLTAEEVASFYHVPPEMVGAREGNFSNLDAFRQMLWNVTLGPQIVAWEQALNVMLHPMYAGDRSVYIEAHVDAKLRGSFLEQAAAYQSAVGAPIMTRNEARRQRNLPAVEGGDELITPLNVLVGGIASPRDTAPKALPGKHRGRVKAERPTDLADADTERARFLDRVGAFWQRHAARIEGSKSLPDLGEVFDTDTVAAELRPIVQAHMQRLAEVGAWDVLAEWNPESEGWGPDQVEAWIATAAETNSGRWASGMRDGLAERYQRDDPEEGLTAFLREHGLTLALVLAGVFAREALSFGGWDAGKKSGLTRKTWNTTSGNPRAEHAALNGVTVGIDDTFPNGLRWPGDEFGTAADNANCQCRITYTR